jgi:predicted O-methyltransferase YrrM
LWGGTVGDAWVPHDDTTAIRTFATTVHDDPAFAAQILPVGDGLLVARLTAPAA